MLLVKVRCGASIYTILGDLKTVRNHWLFMSLWPRELYIYIWNAIIRVEMAGANKVYVRGCAFRVTPTSQNIYHLHLIGKQCGTMWVQDIKKSWEEHLILNSVTKLWQTMWLTKLCPQWVPSNFTSRLQAISSCHPYDIKQQSCVDTTGPILNAAYTILLKASIIHYTPDITAVYICWLF